MSNHTDSTLDWYVDWLKERNPEWTDAQRLEAATGFVAAQQPPQKPVEIEEDEERGAVDARKAERAEERRNRSVLTGDELLKIINSTGEAYRKLNVR
jgi:hypothetical protein